MSLRRPVSAALGLLLGLALALVPAAGGTAAGATVAERLAEHFGAGCQDGEEQRDLFWTKPYLQGSDVRELQQLLQANGLDVGPADGVFGPQTHQAVLEFQRRHAQASDGVVTEATWQSLAGAFPTTAENPVPPPPQGDLLLVIDVPSRTLTVIVDSRPYASFDVAVGKDETPTPTGEWRVVEKSSGWGGGFGERWMGLNVPWGTYGIHGTNKPWSVGRSLSGGCIRMHNEDVIQLWDWVPMGTRVTILGPSLTIPEWAKEPMGRGAEGWVVLAVQRRLREQGYDVGSLDGRFGGQTEQAIRFLQRNRGLKETGRVDSAVYRLLGI